MLVALEGVDGSGKATNAKLLSEYLIARGHKAKVVAFPRDDGPAGVLIRDLLAERFSLGTALPRVIQALMLADRMAAAPYLTDPDCVTICDRYSYSGIVYGAADGLEEPWLYDMHKLLPEASIQILLDTNPEVAKIRRPQMRDRYERDFAKLHRIRDMYLAIWKEKGKAEMGKWYVVDASQPIEAVHAAIVSAYEHAILIKDNGAMSCQTMWKI